MTFDGLDDYELECTAEQERFFRAADLPEGRRGSMRPVAQEREEERIHQLARAAFPGIAAAHPCDCCPPIAGAADPEYRSRIDAAGCTAELKTRSTRRLDAGREPITDSPLLGGPAQGELF